MLLAIDTSQMTYSLALSNGEYCEWNDIETTLSQKLTKYDLSKLTGIIINIGPGRFSGLRSGIAFAQGLSLARNIPIYPVSQFQLVASKVPNTDFSIILDARKNEFYYQSYKNNEAKAEITITNEVKETSKLYGNILPASIIPISAKDLIQLAASSNLSAIKPEDLAPLYVRPPV